MTGSNSQANAPTATPQDEQKLDKKITKHDFYFETPLYEIIKNADISEDLFSGDVDAYSYINNFDTTYKITRYDMDDPYDRGFGGFYKIRLDCKRKDNDTLCFFVLAGKGCLMKVGQLPSMATLQFADLGKKYDKFLAREDMKELKRHRPGRTGRGCRLVCLPQKNIRKTCAGYV